MSRVFFDLLEVNIAISVIILALWLFAGKLRKRYGASWMKLVWILLAVRLMVPYNFSLPSTEIRLFDIPGFEQGESVFGDIAKEQEDIKENSEAIDESQAGTVQSIDNPVAEHNSVENSDQSVIHNRADSSIVENITETDNAAIPDEMAQTVEASEVEAGKNINVSYTEIMTVIWMLGVVLGLLYIAFSYVCFYLECKKDLEVVADEELEQKLIVIQKKLMGKSILVYQSRTILSPMLIGIFSPKLVVPMLSRQWRKEELEMIVAHEICHYKKKDLLLKLLMTAACCVNWFNPLVYLLKRQFFYDMELSCDNSVLSECCEDEREAYARIMLSFAGRPKQVLAFSTGFGESKKRMKKRIDYMLDTGRKKKGIFSIVLTSVVIMIMTVFVSCGYKPYEAGDEKIPGQTGANANDVKGNPIQEEDSAENIVQEEQQQPFDYNHEYNEMLRCYEDEVYLAGGDGIYRLVGRDEKELVYENSYKYRRGMEIYQNSLYFCGSVMRGDREAATIYRMNLTTHEVEDALAAYSQVFDCLYNISVYEGNLYVVCGFESKRIGFELDQNGRIVQQLDESENDFLYREYNDCMDLEWSMLGVPFDSEEYGRLSEESKNQYYSVLDVAACKKLLQGSQVVRKYKDEMYSSIYIENADGTYEFLCDTIYSFPLLITDTGVYYCYMSDQIEYIDYQTKSSKPIYAIEGTDEVILINYDADYVYMIVKHNTGEEANGFRIEEILLLHVPREGGEAETVYQFEGDLQEYGSLTRCAVYDNTMFFEIHDPIMLDIKADT